VTGYDRQVGSGGRPTHISRLAGPALAIVAFTVLLGAAPASAVLPGDIGRFIDAPSQGGGGGGGVFDGLGLILIIGLAVAVVVLAAAVFVLLRTRTSKAPPPSEGWWTCAKCGAGNMDGAARCHACATWRTATPRSTTSASP
jgi:hypothetical protein